MNLAMNKAKPEPIKGPFEQIVSLNSSGSIWSFIPSIPKTNSSNILLPLDLTPQCSTVQSECDPITVRSRSTAADAPELGSVL